MKVFIFEADLKPVYWDQSRKPGDQVYYQNLANGLYTRNSLKMVLKEIKEIVVMAVFRFKICSTLIGQLSEFLTSVDFFIRFS